MWQLESKTKRFLPRLGAPIVHIAAAHNSRYYLVSLQDNSVLILDSAAFDIAHTIVGCRRGTVYSLSMSHTFADLSLPLFQLSNGVG